MSALLRTRLADLFEIGAHPLTLEATDSAPAAGLVQETLTFRTAGGERVRGLLLRPAAPAGPGPAVFIIHAHGHAYGIGADELTHGRPALQGPLGPALARAGAVVLCIDLPCFGTRQHPGESAAAKAALWEGRSLAGQMLGELHAALGHLAARPDVDAARIGAFGISMGATLGQWLAAVDDRVACLAHLCCFADYRALIALGAHDLHGIYLTVPGLLRVASNGRIAGLVAPRPQLVGLGDRDPLTPPAAADPALAELRAAYAPTPDRLVVVRDPEAGHEETSAMRAAVLRCFERHLRLPHA